MKISGPMAESSVSSRTFSIVDLEGSTGGGLTRVGWSAICVFELYTATVCQWEKGEVSWKSIDMVKRVFN